MRGAYCYLPILPARGGAFRAVAALSPDAQSRLTPFFNVPAPALKDGQTLDAYLAKRAEGIHGCWDTERPVYVDVHDLSPELRTSTGAQPIAYLLEQLLMRGSCAVPVTGTEAIRGMEYVDAIRRLVAGSVGGVCVRMAKDELSEPKLIYSAVQRLLDLLRLTPAEVDVILDFEYVGRDRMEVLRATALESLQVLQRVGLFRNVAVSGTSVPDQLNKHTQGKILRTARVELAAWTELIGMFADPAAIALGDYGVIGAHHVPPDGPVYVPSRIRYTTASEHVFRRAKREEYRTICRELLDADEFSGPSFSYGDQRMSRSAHGHAGPGNPGMWVTNDTSHHLELVSGQVWNILQQQGLASRFVLPKPKSRPWLQADLLSH